ncbi:cell division protein FtsX [Falsiporphyromonas endometrii]|uniref:Cell division protein FtsX n=1 Tax=Falsiporphyromonas endometrii TaxID=1387297 RepID=A0ABV9K873_9PORP
MTEGKKTRSHAFFHTRLLSILSVSMVLVIVGSLGLVEIVGMVIKDKVQEQISFNLLLDEDSTPEQDSLLCRKIKSEPFVSDMRYISKAEAAKALEDELGENPVQVLGYNPLQAEIQIHLKSEYAHPDSLGKIDEKIRIWNGVENLSYRQELFDVVHQNMVKVQYFLIAVTILLLIISFIQINNTTRLLIYGKRFQIRTLSLVGATPGFIRKPFVLKSMLDGVWSAILACLIIYGALSALKEWLFPDIYDYLPDIYLVELAGCLLLISVIVSALTSFMAARRYIRMDGSKMHLI